MISLLIRFALIVLLAIGFAWLADQPGDLKLRWLGYEVETSLMAALITLAIVGLILWLVWSIIMWVLDRPGALGSWFKSRRQKKGREALSSGLIAIAAGDKDAAQAHAKTATAVLRNDPMAKLLDAQAAQLRGDSARVLELFEDMTQHPETRLLGLRGLHTEAVRQQDTARARALAEQAAQLNPKVNWASDAVLTYQSAEEDWPAIRSTIDQQRRAKLIGKQEANAKHAVVLTAQAMKVQDSDPEKASDLALQAHKLEPSLVPAAVIAARQLADSGSLRKASRILEKTWALVPHPDIADTYGHLRSGDSAQDRLKRITSLTRKTGGIEGAVSLAIAAIEAHEWQTARKALASYAHDRPQARICGLMAEIEEGEFGDKGRAREWLSRAVRAPRDPAWTADGYISRIWLPVSPVTGELGAFRWRVPVEGIAHAHPEPEQPEDETDADDHIPGDDAVPVAAVEEDGEDDEVQPEDQPAAEDAPKVIEAEPVSHVEEDGQDPEPAIETEPADSERDTEADQDANAADAAAASQEVETTDAPEEKAETVRESDVEDASASEPADDAPMRQPDDPGPQGKAGNNNKSWL